MNHMIWLISYAWLMKYQKRCHDLKLENPWLQWCRLIRIKTWIRPIYSVSLSRIDPCTISWIIFYWWYRCSLYLCLIWWELPRRWVLRQGIATSFTLVLPIAIHIGASAFDNCQRFKVHVVRILNIFLLRNSNPN